MFITGGCGLIYLPPVSGMLLLLPADGLRRVMCLCVTHPTRCLLPLTAPVVRVELTTFPLTAEHSAIELHGIRFQI